MRRGRAPSASAVTWGADIGEGGGAFSIVVFLYYSSVCTLLGLIAFITVGEKLIQVFILTLCYVWFPFAKAKTDAILRLCNLLLFLSPRDVKGFL